MTRKERETIKKWNIAQSKIYGEAQDKYYALREKYFQLNGSVSCSYSNFICEVVNCTKTTEAERNADIYTIIKYHEAEGRDSSLLDFISKQ